jgi:single-strand DNA-binding protein
MGSLNKVILIGNLGRDPEIRYTPDGTPVANFSIATTESWTDKGGSRQDRTEWHNVVAWRKLAELSKRFLTKGKQVYIEGKLQTREWNDKDGNKRRTTEVIANQMILLGPRTDQNATSAPVPQAWDQRAPEADTAFQDSGSGITDDDIPF